MSWIKKTPAEIPHSCELPGGRRSVMYPRPKIDWGQGSLWRCDECGREWKWFIDTWIRHMPAELFQPPRGPKRVPR